MVTKAGSAMSEQASAALALDDPNSFYLGRLWDKDRAHASDQPLLYQSADLTSHCVILGMTGSGKTGLGVCLLEEAALDGIPSIVVDLKGDLANLALSFPRLAPKDFLPWIDATEARRAGQSPEDAAATTAARWRAGLANCGLGPAQIEKLHQTTEIALFTPASDAGRPISVLGSLAAPSPAVLADPEIYREKISATAAGLLGLVGIDADPLRSREHIFLSTLIDQAWKAGRSLSLEGLVSAVQSPGFTQVGVLDLEAFYPSKDRFRLMMALNGLIASPGFAAFRMGEPLSIERLLRAPDGRPRLSIVSVAHLAEAERRFFLTLLLTELVAWMRSQAGTGSLRALLYLDEVFGLMPPTSNPSTKGPLLTLLKQARAYGLGIVLATQNPVDLDYKALSNAGTWMLGRLSTERDQARVLDGLEQAGASLDRAEFGRVISGLPKRAFVMRNVHEDQPAVFESRFAMSYLRGPLTRPQLITLGELGLVSSGVPTASAAVATSAPKSRGGNAPLPTTGQAPTADAARPFQATPPVLPQGFQARYLQAKAGTGGPYCYQPWLYAEARLHYAKASLDLDLWVAPCVLVPAPHDAPEPAWEAAELSPSAREAEQRWPLAQAPHADYRFSPLPRALARPKSPARSAKQLKTYFYRQQRLQLHRCRAVKLSCRPDESLEAFSERASLALRERRDLKLEKFKSGYAKKLARLQTKIRSADERTDRERDQLSYAERNRTITLGSSMLGAVFGRSLFSRSNATRAGMAMRSQSRVGREKEDVARAQEKLALLKQQLTALEAEFQQQLAALSASLSTAPEIETMELAPKKSDIELVELEVAWRPSTDNA